MGLRKEGGGWVEEPQAPDEEEEESIVWPDQGGDGEGSPRTGSGSWSLGTVQPSTGAGARA